MENGMWEQDMETKLKIENTATPNRYDAHIWLGLVFLLHVKCFFSSEREENRGTSEPKIIGLFHRISK